jgi:hypothetical protein
LSRGGSIPNFTSRHDDWRTIGGTSRDYGCLVVIYVDPRHREVFERTGEFAVADDTSGILILTIIQTPPDHVSAPGGGFTPALR